MCELLVSTSEVMVLDIADSEDRLPGTVETPMKRPSCPSCGDEVGVKDRPVVALTDLPCFGMPAVLV